MRHATDNSYSSQGPGNNSLVSIVLLTYNQEKFVENAVKSVLAQSYKPLEIIISDDCSTDNTLMVIESAIKNNNKSNHSVQLIKTSQNLGPVGNLYFATNVARGQVIVLASGDDISKSDRVERLAALIVGNTVAAFSAMEIINQDGRSVKVHRPWTARKRISLKHLCKEGGIGAGATYAYRREIFYWPELYEGNSVSEDRIFPFRASIIGKIAYINEPLIQWRNHGDNLSNIAIKQWDSLTYTISHYKILMGYLLEGRRQNYINESELQIASTALLESLKLKIVGGSIVRKMRNWVKKFVRKGGYSCR